MDEFNDLSFENVPEAEMASWDAMFAVLLTGVQFDYYPDSTNQFVYTAYTLEDSSWAPKRVSWQNYSFTLKLRQFVGTPAYYSRANS